MVIALRVRQFWSEIKLVITDRTPATRSCDFVITRLISDQIALHSVQLPLYIRIIVCVRYTTALVFVQGTHCLMLYNNITYEIDLLVHNLVLNALVKPGLEFIKVGK